jgi:hypothetical protein
MDIINTSFIDHTGRWLNYTSCQHCNDFLGSAKTGEFLEWLSHYEILKDFVP